MIYEPWHSFDKNYEQTKAATNSHHMFTIHRAEVRKTSF